MKFESHKASFARFVTFHTMESFKSYKDIIRDQVIFFVNELWCFVIMEGIFFFNLFASILENFLQMTLQRLLGRYSKIDCGFFIFGIGVMKV